MGGIGRVLGGLLTGAGEGLEKQSMVDMQAKRDSALAEMQARRETALAALNHQYRVSEATTTADLTDRNAGRNDARDFAYGTKKADQKFTQDKALKAIDFSNSASLEGLKHKYNLSEGAADDARTLDHDLKVAGVTVDHWEVTTDGRLTAYNKQGQLLSHTSVPGNFVPDGTKAGDDDEGGTIASAAAARGGGGAKKPEAKTKPTAQGGSSVLSQLARMPPPPDGQVGRTMTGPNGMKARWTGKTWELVGDSVPHG